MIGRKPRFQIAIMIVEILEKKYSHSLRYKELEEEVNLRCKGKKPSTATLTKYLDMLSGRKSQYLSFIYKGVLHRKVEENRSTHYSLTKQFKDSQAQDTLSLPQFSDSEADDEKPIEIIEPSENEVSPDDKKI
jgi:transposase